MDEILKMVLIALPYVGFGWLLGRYPALRPPMDRHAFLVGIFLARPFVLFGMGLAIFTAVIAALGASPEGLLLGLIVCVATWKLGEERERQ
jgi:hypothetical protein